MKKSENLWDKAGFESRRWEVRAYVVDGSIYVYPGCGLMGGEGIYVSPPNFFESLFGITLDQKLDRAIAKVQRCVGELNQKIEHEHTMDRYLESYKKKRGMV